MVDVAGNRVGKRSMRLRVLTLLLVAMLGLAACGGDDEESSGETTATETSGGAAGGDAAAGEASFGEMGCGTCHTLEAAGATGTNCPNLDDSQPDFDLVVERVTNGSGLMPSFKDRLSEEEIRNVAAFVSENAGG